MDKFRIIKLSMMLFFYLSPYKFALAYEGSYGHFNPIFQLENELVAEIEWNTDETMVAVARRYYGVTIYNNKFEEIAYIASNLWTAYDPIDWLPNDNLALLRNAETTIYLEVWEILPIDLVKQIDIGPASSIEIEWNSTGTAFLVGGQEEGVIWDLANEEIRQTLIVDAPARTYGFYYVAWHPIENIIATNGLDDNTLLWDADRGTIIKEIPHRGQLFWHKAGHSLVIANESQILLWDYMADEVIWITPIPDKTVIWQLATQNNTLILVNSTDDYTMFNLYYLNFNAGEIIDNIKLPPSGRTYTLFNNGTQLLYANDNNQITELPVPEYFTLNE